MVAHCALDAAPWQERLHHRSAGSQHHSWPRASSQCPCRCSA